MSQLSNVLKELQEDDSSVKTSQAKVSVDITAIFEKAEEAESWMMDIQGEDGWLSNELVKMATVNTVTS